MSQQAKSYEIDQNSPTWRAINRFIEDRLVMRRGNLEACGHPRDETENDRGAIEELNELLRLAQPRLVDAEAPFDTMSEL